MEEATALIIGASVSGLAAAASLKKNGIDCIIIEKEAQIATPWRNHYDRLHLHTPKSVSNLPYKKFDRNIPRYPSRQQVISYLEAYREEFGIHPGFNTQALSVKKEGDSWITETVHAAFRSKYLITATGAYAQPKEIAFKGMQTFPGKIIHSYGYKTGRDFKGQKVLVVGFGNSACEIAIDLYEQGAVPVMSVRSPVNMVPRDLLGIPILAISQLMSRLPARVADTINAPVMRLYFGDITRLGLKKMKYGVFEQIGKDGTIPLLDIGTISHIRKGHITIRGSLDHIDGTTVHFEDGKKENVDSIIAAIGYQRNDEKILNVEKERFGDLNASTRRQKFFGKDGLYFCGFHIASTGQFREIALDAKRIAKDIKQKEAG